VAALHAAGHAPPGSRHDRRRARLHGTTPNGYGAPTVLRALALLLVVACQRTPTYTTMGDVVEIDEDGARVTLRHDDVPRVLAAGTTAFAVASPDVWRDTPPGTRVRFDAVPRAGGLVVTAMARVDGAPAAQAPTGGHSHAPAHGGVVTMVGTIHLEVVATRAGELRIYPSDLWRRPLPVDGMTGSVTLDVPGGGWAGSLRAAGDALRADAPPLAGPDVTAHVRLTRDGEAIEAYVGVPVDAGGEDGGSAARRCLPVVVPADARGRSPRCAFDFGLAVSAVVGAPASGAVLVALHEGDLTAWRVADGRAVATFAPPPAPPGPVPGAQHQIWGAIAASPDGRQAVVGIRQRLLRYSVGSGRLLRTLSDADGGLVRDVAWSADGARLVVTRTFDPVAHVLTPADGAEVRRLEAEGQPLAVALGRDGAAAVGLEAGPILLWDGDGTGAARRASTTGGGGHAFAFVGTRLWSADGDRLVVHDGAGVRETPARATILRLAASQDGTRVASADAGGTIRVHDPDTGEVRETLDWHRTTLAGLAWVGDTLVSGDARGRVALWDVGDARVMQ